MPISPPVDDEANGLLSRNALALLIAMLLDQPVPLERAFSAPRALVADITDAESLIQVRSYKQAMKAAAKAKSTTQLNLTF